MRVLRKGSLKILNPAPNLWVLIPSFSSLRHESLHTSLKQKQNKVMWRAVLQNQCQEQRTRRTSLWLGPWQQGSLQEARGTNVRPVREAPCSAPAWAWSRSLSVLSSRSFLRPMEINDSTACIRRGPERLQIRQILNKHSISVALAPLGLVCRWERLRPRAMLCRACTFCFSQLSFV